jgi:addiction module HigA family antidote
VTTSRDDGQFFKMTSFENEYTPDAVSAPGETLAEIIKNRGMSLADFAARMGCAERIINEIIKGKAAITSDIALRLERVLGVPASFWNMREQNYMLTRQREHGI